MSVPFKSSPDFPIDDIHVPGLAGERTDLAWNRTGLAAVVAAAAIVRQSWQAVDTVTGRVAIFSILGVGALTWTGALWWAHLMRTTLEGRPTADGRRLRVVTAGTTIFALCALILAVLPS